MTKHKDFVGVYPIQVDIKWRFAIPTALRKNILKEFQAVVLPDPLTFMFPAIIKGDQKPFAEEEANLLRQFGEFCRMDVQGRITLPKSFQTFIKNEKPDAAVLIARKTHAHIITQKEWDKFGRERYKDEISRTMVPFLKKAGWAPPNVK